MSDGQRNDSRGSKDGMVAAVPNRPPWARPIEAHFAWLRLAKDAVGGAPESDGRRVLRPHRALCRPLFWLHIKKSGGTSMRRMLTPVWDDIDSFDVLPSFKQVDSRYWNTLLNNARTPLGDYGNRRLLFARDFLYSNWSEILSFAVARNPLDRAVSMFFYKYVTPYQSSVVRRMLRFRGSPFGLDRLFDRFLDAVEITHRTPSAFTRQTDFAAHTAPMTPDITDAEGRLLATRVVRFEHFVEGLRAIVEECGGDPGAIEGQHEQRGKKRDRSRPFTPSPRQVRRIDEVFAGDFEHYETAWRP